MRESRPGPRSSDDELREYVSQFGDAYSPDYFRTMRDEFAYSRPDFPEDFPPLIILVEPSRMRIGDGFHRGFLCRAFHIPTFPAVVGRYLKDSDVPIC